MNPTLIVVEALLLGGLILCVEWLRPRPPGRVDFLRATSGIYFICFVFLPPYLLLTEPRVLRGTQWEWLLKRPFDDVGFVYAGGLALIGYCCLVLGWYLAGGHRASAPSPAGTAPRSPWPDRHVYLVAMGLGLVGLLCLFVYVRSIGGLTFMIVQAVAFRGRDPPVVTPFAFLKTLSPMVIAAALMLYGLQARARLTGRPSRYTLSLVVLFAASFLVLFHQAGRFPLALFLLAFPLARIIRTGQVRLAGVVVAATVVLGLLLFGKQLFEATLSSGVLTARWDSVGRDAAAGVRAVAVEFAFPAVTAANATREVPAELGFRWFYDFPLALEYLVPQRLVGVAHPLTVSMVNTSRFDSYGAIPVDIVSLGYFSAGVPGVALLLAGFGALLVWLDRILPSGLDPVVCILRAAWILFIAVRVMYGDPQLIWPGGLHLILAAGLLFAVRVVAERRAPAQANLPPPSSAIP